ncbi:MAG: hypothetical protein JWL95_2419, partial [Gemmatimonadetes bacterium]|nr:hypothetical protein [Gemmatimonadota bacterium]
MIATLRRAVRIAPKVPRTDPAYPASEPILGESFGADQLARHARQLARRHQPLVQPPPGPTKQRGRGQLLSRLDAIERDLRTVHASLAAAVASGVPVSPAGDWLLDNFYVVLEQAHEIRATLPSGYYRELPKLAGDGALAGHPRVYELAVELIAHTDGRLDMASVELMVRQYQRIVPLTMGELWAMPAMLRMGFLENVGRMAHRAERDVVDTRNADAWVARLLAAEDSQGTALGEELSRLVNRPPSLSPAFLTRFLQQIRSRRADFTPLLWLEQWVAEDFMSVDEAVQRSAQHLALTQLVMSNSIASLRAVANVDWHTFVENLSATEAMLRRDPAGVYDEMTFATRDRYRHVVEHLARRTLTVEHEVASGAVAMALAALNAGEAAHAAHVGYYLVDDGRAALEASLGYRPGVRETLYRWAKRHPTVTYIGAVTLLLLAVVAAMLSPLRDAMGARAILAFALVLAPSADVAIALVNQLVMVFVPPGRLPRMDYRTGVPVDERTVVVVPILLGSVAAVRDALDHLEAQHLANRDPQIRFTLLGDFLDAKTQTAEDDAAIVAAAVEGVRALNLAHAEDGGGHGAAPFYFFHRPRRWNAADRIWMGWERKRGKLADFNRFVRTMDATPFTITEGATDWLGTVRYVITLDSDTVLPRDSGAALVGTMAHPLNRAAIDEATARVLRGYGILQPRVGVSLASANSSRFAAIFAGHAGVDPYTTAVSDVYQDLFGQGTFTGKGIYDVEVFERATAGRFPPNALLSHDLIEGAFARAGLVTDVEVFDDYPARYLTATRRLHRWIRGDWQLLPWLLNKVPGTEGPTDNPLSALSRWKITDNMRRSLNPVATLALIVAGWTVLPRPGLAWTLAALAALFAPWVTPLVIALFRPPRGESWGPYYAGIGRDATAATTQFALAVVMLPHQAMVSLDAIVRTLVRVFVTRRRLLEWQTASQVEATTASHRQSVWRVMWPSVALSLALLSAMATRASRPSDWIIVAAFALAWTLAPEMAFALSAPRERADLALLTSERATALRYAREHWQYFAHFVGPDTHWLVPDNFQATPSPVVATRTSPTNIGLQLLSTIAAHDLGILARTEMLDRLEYALNSMERMARAHGHFFNWYDLSDLRVLEPPYVSAVDSGNFAGHLMAMAEACLELAHGAPAPDVLRLETLAVRARTTAMEMDFALFYDPSRRLMSIGYDPRTGRLDDSSYDLLASEARLASFVAVAKGDVPAEHWFHLGRSLTTSDGSTALVSWSGSMFEYLMPLLVIPSRPFSLLDQTHQAAVRRQIAYGHARGVPWGISESAYNMRDRHDTYQYRAFGVPGLGLKRGLARDLVIAPYASALALAVDPHEAMRNLAALEKEGALGPYGFCDAVDYTRPDTDGRHALVQTYMAHHVGMSLVALDNVLHLKDGQGIWQRRFMADPAARAAALLLDERVPRRYTVQSPSPYTPDDASERSAPVDPVVRDEESPDTPEPRVGLLGGAGYAVLLTNAGGGYSRSDRLDVFRWRADVTRDATGQWIYLRDVASESVWSAAHQPVRSTPSSYRVTFAADRVVFARADGAFETRTDVVVVPRERAEIRRVVVTNRSRQTREVELTSYGEIVLTDAAADRSHPAFQNLFVETEWVPTHSAVLAARRPRSAEERRPWCAHVVATGPECVSDVTCETDRARFIGRGRTTSAPLALDDSGDLSCTAGAVLDPIASLRVRVRLEPGRSATVAFTTIVDESRDAVLLAADRYRDLGAAERALALSGTEATIELRNLDLAPADAALYQELAGALIYQRDALRAPQFERMANKRGQQALWAHGISGDWPIVLATIRGANGLPSVRQLLVAHKYWRMKGVRSDLVILNAKEPSYIQELQDQLTAMVISSTEGGTLDSPGGVFIRRSDVIPAEDVAMLRATASIHVVCDGVGLGEVVAATVRVPNEGPRPPARIGRPRIVRSAHEPASAPRQRYANGYGALTPDGDYEITVDGTTVPPAPWCNVIANVNAGFCVSERGAGYAWAENSFFYRLTPWYNDPVSDPAGEAIFIQDDFTGRCWSPTPAPMAARDGGPAIPPYVVRHAPGRTTFTHERDWLVTELTLAVPADDPVKISRLRVTNRGRDVRHLTITSYVEWALGAERENARQQVHTRLDGDTGAILAQNFYNEEFASRVAFSWISEPVTSATGHRGAFIGRNGDLAAPAALENASLGNTFGAGYDPCAALRCSIVLAPGETKELVVLLGATRSDDDARAVIARNGAPERAAQSIDAAVADWDRRLSVVTVRTPSPELDALVNRWTLYQTLACRIWARSALYQSSGAYGFRDQLQDGMAMVYSEPALVRAHLLRSASHQFTEGDVQHWWHEPSGRGVRTR